MRIRGFAAAMAAFAFVWVPSRSHAYSLGEHDLVTNFSVTEFNACFQNLISSDTQDKIRSADLNEDLNLIRKWSAYSHFFHPEKTLPDQRRYDSSIRITELEHEILRLLVRGDLIEAYYELGHAIHHLQDMASPPHVVPVMHGLDDSYESYPMTLDETPDLKSTDADCRAAAAAGARDTGLLDLLYFASRQTLSNVRAGLPSTRDGQAAGLTWLAIWRESATDSFGSYGMLGNSFGRETIDVADGPGGGRYRITTGTYKEFKRRQLRLAMDVTGRALSWFTRQDWATP